MRKVITLSLSLCFLGFITPLESLAQPQAPVQSPEINEDRTVTFRYDAPEAKEVELSAEFLDNNKALAQNDEGVWSITVGPIEPDIYPYFFIVDGVSVADKSNPDIFPNERFKRSVVDIPADTPLLQAMQDVPHGTISYRNYKSESLDLIRPVVIYTPPGYNEEPSREYPVLYLIHGMTDTEETWYKVGRVNLILDNLIAQGKAEPMIVVMPYANPYPALQKKGRDVNVDLLGTEIFRREILEEVIPYTENHYLVHENAEHRAIAGFSLGGRQTLAAGLANPRTFSWVAAYAPAIWEREFEDNFSNLYASSGTLNKELNLLWVSCGRSDGLFESSEAFLSELDERDINYKSLFTEGGHTWMNVRNYFAETAQLLFK